MSNKFHIFGLLLGFMITSYPVHANIYKCVNKKGAIYYNDKPCPKKDKEIELKAVKDPKSRYIPKHIAEKKDVVSSNKGIIVGEGISKNMAKKDKSKKNKDENLLSQTNINTNNKTLDSINKDSVSSSKSSSGSSAITDRDGKNPDLKNDKQKPISKKEAEARALEKRLEKLVN